MGLIRRCHLPCGDCCILPSFVSRTEEGNLVLHVRETRLHCAAAFLSAEDQLEWTRMLFSGRGCADSEAGLSGHVRQSVVPAIGHDGCTTRGLILHEEERCSPVSQAEHIAYLCQCTRQVDCDILLPVQDFFISV